MAPLNELVLKRRPSLHLHIPTRPKRIAVSVLVRIERDGVVRIPIAEGGDVADDEDVVAEGGGLGDGEAELDGGGVGAGGGDVGDGDSEAGGAGGGAAVSLGVLLAGDFLGVDGAGVG